MKTLTAELAVEGVMTQHCSFAAQAAEIVDEATSMAVAKARSIVGASQCQLQPTWLVALTKAEYALGLSSFFEL